MMLRRIKALFGTITLIVLMYSSHTLADGKYTANECFENFSRGTLKFNQGLDKAIFKPIAKGYRALPVPIRMGTSNVVGNLRSLLTLSNNLLQGDLKGAGNTAGRFLINSTVGILGVLIPQYIWDLQKKVKKILARPLGFGERILVVTLFYLYWDQPQLEML